MSKKLLALLIVGLCVILISSLPISAAKKYKIGVSIFDTNCDTLVVYSDYTKYLVEKKYNATAVVVNANSDYSKLVKDLENLIQMNCDAILIGPVDAASIAKPVEKAVQKGIPVIGLDTELVEGMLFTAFCNNVAMGAKTAMFLAEYINGKGKVAKMYMTVNLPHRQRSKAFDVVMTEYPNIEVVAKYALNVADPVADTYNAARDIILANPDLDAFWCSWDLAALGIVRAIKESGKNIVVTGIDGNKANRALLDDPNSPYIATCYEDARAITDWVVKKTFDYLKTKKAPRPKVNCIECPFWTKDDHPKPFDELKW